MVSTADKKIRYAVVGLGAISQEALLPSFKNAKENSVLTALVSSDPEKLKSVGEKYGVKNLYSYAEYDKCLKSGEVDAVYIGLPNDLHRLYAEKALKAGVHVLCEKPMSVRAEEAESMVKTAREAKKKLMIAYRLHFEKANLEVVRLIQEGVIGTPRLFNSVFTMNVKDLQNFRLEKKHGGGTLYDIGIYCINAARYLFRAEPIDAFAWSANNLDERSDEVDESTASVLRFPDEKIASFTTSFGTEAEDFYEVLGTKGKLRLSPAYGYTEDSILEVTVNEKKTEFTFKKTDQFGPELTYFSQCILQDRDPEPSGLEGLTDVKIIEALYASAQNGKPVSLEMKSAVTRPTLAQEIDFPAFKPPKMVNARNASDPS